MANAPFLYPFPRFLRRRNASFSIIPPWRRPVKAAAVPPGAPSLLLSLPRAPSRDRAKGGGSRRAPALMMPFRVYFACSMAAFTASLMALEVTEAPLTTSTASTLSHTAGQSQILCKLQLG